MDEIWPSSQTLTRVVTAASLQVSSITDPPPTATGPIHQDGNPFTAPLGLPFADHVHVEPIPARTAEAIYTTHHSYIPDLAKIFGC